ncbi:hypothetical protein WA026_000465 [Henosepilachna vigintioctopunctata]|uniref:Uncharacterized protein n=1 Tax=Henosepilachna vigintioctopunctata TaxID=420089 RepID=A0AAW1V7P1_9CUCU
MKENNDTISYRKNILENLIDKPPFRCEKCSSSDGGNIDINESENVVNISFTRNRLDASTSNERCHTTINLFINDPSVVQKKCEECSCVSRKNEVILGKNIPNHNLMENLLDDLDVRKFSSAPTMNCLQNEFSRSSRKPNIRNSQRRTPKTEIMETEHKKMSILYLNDKRCKGDFQRESIDELMEEINEETPESDTIHRNNEYVIKIQSNKNVPNLESRSHLVRSQEKVSQGSLHPENTGILYRDTVTIETAEVGKPVQPRRKTSAFPLRTRMVKDVHKTDPELVNTYYSKLMTNQKKMFETLRHSNFQEDAPMKDGKSSVMEIRESIKNNTHNPDRDSDNEKLLAFTRRRSEMGEIDKGQSPDLLTGENSKTVCSIESHGSYDDYKRNLIKRPDGTMCCRNAKDPDDDIWSRAETRNIITSEFIKDKIRRFEKIAKKKSRNQDYILNSVNETIEEINSTLNDFEKSSELPLIPEKESNSSVLFNENAKSISFPKETKNAMMRLLSENLNNNPKYNRLKSKARKWDAQLERNKTAGQGTKPHHRVIGNEEKNTRFWPGMAERVRVKPEGNIP